MSRTLQFKRYDSATVSNTIGANGELIIDSTHRGLTIHDGTTRGGHVINGSSYPQNPQSNNYVLKITDAGKYIYNKSSTNNFIYIPPSSQVPFSNGTNILLVTNKAENTYVTVSPNTGVQLYSLISYLPPILPPQANSGNTVVTSRCRAQLTLVDKVENLWYISGAGIVINA